MFPGIGEVKILLDERSNKARITMRRDQIFRVCCNHFITSDMSVNSKEGTKAAWTWCTPADASESEVRPEQFTIKFKTQEIADQFKEVFKACQSFSVKKESVSGTCQEASRLLVKNLNKKKSVPGQWTCEDCYESNTLDAMQCIVGKNVKPGCIDVSPGSVLGTPSFLESAHGQMLELVLASASHNSFLEVNSIPSSRLRLATPKQTSSDNNLVPAVFSSNKCKVQPDHYDCSVDGSTSLDCDPNIYVKTCHTDGITQGQFDIHKLFQPVVQQSCQNFGYLVNDKSVEKHILGIGPTSVNSSQLEKSQKIVSTPPERKLIKYTFSNQQNNIPLRAGPCSNGKTQQDTSKVNPFAEFTFQNKKSGVKSKSLGTAVVSSPSYGSIISSKPTNFRADKSVSQVSVMKTGSETGFPILTSSFQTSVTASTTTHMINYATQIKETQRSVITSPERNYLYKLIFSNDQTKKPFQAHAYPTGATPKDTSKTKPFAGITFQRSTSEKNSKNSAPAVVSSSCSGCIFSLKPTNFRVYTSAPQISTLKTSGGTSFPILTSSPQTSVTASISTQVADHLMQFNVAKKIVTALSEGKSLFKFTFSNDQAIKPSQTHPNPNDPNQQDTSEVNDSAKFTFQKAASERNTQSSRTAVVSSLFTGFGFSSKPTNSQMDISALQELTVKATNGRTTRTSSPAKLLCTGNATALKSTGYQEDPSTEVKENFEENSEGNLEIMHNIEEGNDSYQRLAANSSCRRSNEVMEEEVDESKQVEER